jgi:glycosyltransferase involved in cell wall biosynthesis
VKYKRIWITWESQRRNKSLSKKLNAKYFEVITNKPSFIRYPINLIKTLFIFLKEQPQQIFVQNPSIVLALFSVVFSKIMHSPIIVDAHNAGVYPLEGTSDFFNTLAKYIFSNASLTLVTNTYLADYVRKNGGDAFVLPDPLPDFPIPENIIQNKSSHSVLFICTWAVDEPYLEVIKAAQHIDKSITINITGNVKEKEIQKIISPIAENINFTGFLPDNDYISLLYSSDIIIDLTTRENCLVCGAYEGVSCEKPLILSDKKILKEYFYKGVVFTENNDMNIAESINYAITNLDNLNDEVKQLRYELTSKWESDLVNLEGELARILSK